MKLLLILIMCGLFAGCAGWELDRVMPAFNASGNIGKGQTLTNANGSVSQNSTVTIGSSVSFEFVPKGK